jgi:hypothetical protein
LASRTVDALTRINRAEKAIRQSRTLTPEQKREQIERFNLLRNDIARRAMQAAPAITRAVQGLSRDAGERARLPQSPP